MGDQPNQVPTHAPPPARDKTETFRLASGATLSRPWPENPCPPVNFTGARTRHTRRPQNDVLWTAGAEPFRQSRPLLIAEKQDPVPQRRNTWLQQAAAEGGNGAKPTGQPRTRRRRGENEKQWFLRIFDPSALPKEQRARVGSTPGKSRTRRGMVDNGASTRRALLLGTCHRPPRAKAQGSAARRNGEKRGQTASAQEPKTGGRGRSRPQCEQNTC